MITSSITIDDSNKHLYTLFESEIQDMNRERCAVKITWQNEQSIIQITAKDPTALRATYNSICKQLVIYDKMTRI
ncbi:MAG: hypothetical protein ACMXYA_01675 [Candidatus Woesearchaeota archaeon]